jgi:hypothetical protein
VPLHAFASAAFCFDKPYDFVARRAKQGIRAGG